MLVHVISRQLSDVSHLPPSAIESLIDKISTSGFEVHTDIQKSMTDAATTARQCEEALRRRWKQSSPDVIHSLGVAATTAALAARPDQIPIVATFDEHPVSTAIEQRLARMVDAVMPMSIAEQDDWRNRGVKVLTHLGTVAVPEPAVSESPTSKAGHVVTMARGEALEKIIASMQYWPGNRLVVLGPLPDRDRTQLRRMSRKLGLHDRIDYRPATGVSHPASIWRGAGLLLAGEDSARHAAHVLQAAAHGVAAVAVAQEAHLDHILPGATGVLYDGREGIGALGSAVAALLRDPLRCRGMGASALSRVSALHGLEAAGHSVRDGYLQLKPEPQELAGPLMQTTSTTPPLTAQGEKLALDHMQLARQLAHRYSGRGQRIDDLVQVASLGLVRAAARFNPDRGSEFHSFAVPTILGELRRHFRDHGWAARVPRSLQEASLKVQKVSDEVRAATGQEATTAQVAEKLGLLEEEVLQAMQARGEAMSSKSLDHPMGENGDETFVDLVGDVDGNLEYVELRESVTAALQQLPEREREILLMRFYGEHTQAEIAERLGLSQVHVSRLITRTLAALRDHVLNDVPLPRSWHNADDVTEVATQRKAA